MSPTILIVHGAMATGKSSVCRLLSEKLPNFVFLDREYLKLNMLKNADRQVALDVSKDAVHAMAKQLMPLKLNLLLQEERASSIRKALGDEIEKYGYRIISFYLYCDVETAIKRDWKRGGRVRVSLVKEMQKLHGYPDKENIQINTDTHRLEEVVHMIMHELK